MEKLYFTHCCAKKDDSLRSTGEKVSPIRLYRAAPTQRFMKRSSESSVQWAIFSDKYGFVFPRDRIQWYEKHPKTVTPSEKKKLFDDAFNVLQRYNVAYFYYNPGRLHPLYREFVQEMRRRGLDVLEITHLDEILK